MSKHREHIEENKSLRKKLDIAVQALRDAPMPYRESTLGDEWDDAYDAWWHMWAEEDSIRGLLGE